MELMDHQGLLEKLVTEVVVELADHLGIPVSLVIQVQLERQEIKVQKEALVEREHKELMEGKDNVEKKVSLE